MEQNAEAGLLGMLDRLKSAQRTLLLTASQGTALPSDGTLRKISELEGAIAATEALLSELGEKR